MKKGKGRLSTKQRALIQGIAKGLSVSEAARQAGFDEKQSTHQVYRMIQTPTFQNKLAELMQDQGLADDVLLVFLKEGLKATRTNAKGEEIADHATRHKYLETALKIRGGFAPTKGIKANVSFDLSEILKAAQNG